MQIIRKGGVYERFYLADYLLGFVCVRDCGFGYVVGSVACALRMLLNEF